MPRNQGREATTTAEQTKPGDRIRLAGYDETWTVAESPAGSPSHRRDIRHDETRELGMIPGPQRLVLVEVAS